MTCPCCNEWPCARQVAEDEARWEAREDARMEAAEEEDPDLASLEATPEGQDWTPMERESPDDLGDWPNVELGGEA